MQIWPAIDLRGGKCVRLQQGDYERETIFGEDPAAMASQFVADGAECLHLVDLDGARDGDWVNREAVQSILAAVDIPCELGGGVRSEATIQTMLDAGLSRLVLGTKAIKEPDWFRDMVRKFPHKLVLGLDARDGRVASDGWLEDSEITAVELAKSFEDEPVAAIVYTDISRDGMMAGPNFAATAELQKAVSTPIVASGGVTTLDDVKKLAELRLDGCIIGRSLYEGRISLTDAIEASNNQANN